MELDSEEQRLGMAWLIIAGTVAILFAFFLYKTDNALSTSQRDIKLGDNLYRLRTAQTTLIGSDVDPRLTSKVVRSTPEKTTETHTPAKH